MPILRNLESLWWQLYQLTEKNTHNARRTMRYRRNKIQYNGALTIARREKRCALRIYLCIMYLWTWTWANFSLGTTSFGSRISIRRWKMCGWGWTVYTYVVYGRFGQWQVLVRGFVLCSRDEKRMRSFAGRNDACIVHNNSVRGERSTLLMGRHKRWLSNDKLQLIFLDASNTPFENNPKPEIETFSCRFFLDIFLQRLWDLYDYRFDGKVDFEFIKCW